MEEGGGEVGGGPSVVQPPPPPPPILSGPHPSLFLVELSLDRSFLYWGGK